MSKGDIAGWLAAGMGGGMERICHCFKYRGWVITPYQVAEWAKLLILLGLVRESKIISLDKIFGRRMRPIHLRERTVSEAKANYGDSGCASTTCKELREWSP